MSENAESPRERLVDDLSNVLGEAEEKLRQAGCELWIAGLNPAVFAVVERSKFGATLGHGRMFLNMQEAVERFQARGRGET